MRGKEKGVKDNLDSVRITPAYAGKSKSGEMTVSHSGDHPRLCGEKACVLQRHLQTEGSPPPMRGKGRRCCGNHTVNGDHPRLCGEKEICDGRHRRENGSPPPMRGKVTHGERRKLRRRITPAYAGKSGFQCRHNVLHKDHPRLCGEK